MKSDLEKAEIILNGGCSECFHDVIGRHKETCHRGWSIDEATKRIFYNQSYEEYTIEENPTTLQSMYKFLTDSWSQEPQYSKKKKKRKKY